MTLPDHIRRSVVALKGEWGKMAETRSDATGLFRSCVRYTREFIMESWLGPSERKRTTQRRISGPRKVAEIKFPAMERLSRVSVRPNKEKKRRLWKARVRKCTHRVRWNSFDFRVCLTKKPRRVDSISWAELRRVRTTLLCVSLPREGNFYQSTPVAKYLASATYAFYAAIKSRIP